MTNYRDSDPVRFAHLPGGSIVNLDHIVFLRPIEQGPGRPPLYYVGTTSHSGYHLDQQNYDALVCVIRRYTGLYHAQTVEHPADEEVDITAIEQAVADGF